MTLFLVASLFSASWLRYPTMILRGSYGKYLGHHMALTFLHHADLGFRSSPQMKISVLITGKLSSDQVSRVPFASAQDLTLFPELHTNYSSLRVLHLRLGCYPDRPVEKSTKANFHTLMLFLGMRRE